MTADEILETMVLSPKNEQRTVLKATMQIKFEKSISEVDPE
jgi:hypothetical protein